MPGVTIDKEKMREELIALDQERVKVAKFIEDQRSIELGFNQKKTELREKATNLLMDYLVFNKEEAYSELVKVKDELDIIRLFDERKIDLMKKLRGKHNRTEQEMHQREHYLRSQGEDWRKTTGGLKETYWKRQFENLKDGLEDCTISELESLIRQLREIATEHGETIGVRPIKVEALVDQRRDELNQIKASYNQLINSFLRTPTAETAEKIMEAAYYLNEVEYAESLIEDRMGSIING